MCHVAIVCGRMRQKELILFTYGDGIGAKKSYLAIFTESENSGSFTLNKTDNTTWTLPDMLRPNCKPLSEANAGAPLVRYVWARESERLKEMILLDEELMRTHSAFSSRITSYFVVTSPPPQRRLRVQAEIDASVLREKRAKDEVIDVLTSCCNEWCASHDLALQEMGTIARPYLPSMVCDYLTSLMKASSIKFNFSFTVPIHKTDRTYMNQYQSLLRKQHLPPMTRFQKDQCLHVGVIRNGELVAAMSFLFACVNKLPIRVAVSIEFAVSLEGSHGGTLIWEELLRNLKARKSPKPCIVVTQGAYTAERFWNGKMTSSSKAICVMMMFSRLSNRYKMYSDTHAKILYV